MKTFTVESALINLYNSTRSAPLPLEEHDNNRACVDILAQALGMQLNWSVPTEDAAEEGKPAKAEIASETADGLPVQKPLFDLNKKKKKS